MELKPQFAEFLSSIRPTESQKEAWKVGSKTLRARLADDPVLGKIVVATFLQGSVRRSTAIRPTDDKRPDVDVVVVTTIDRHTTTPQQAMDLFVPFLEKHYPGKWRPQGRSFGIELSYVDLDLVITALPSDKASRDIMERLYRSQSVLSSNTLEEDASWRLNKNWAPGTLGSDQAFVEDASQNEWRPHPLYLPDREVGNWGSGPLPKTAPAAGTTLVWFAPRSGGGRPTPTRFRNIPGAIRSST